MCNKVIVTECDMYREADLLLLCVICCHLQNSTLAAMAGASAVKLDTACDMYNSVMLHRQAKTHMALVASKRSFSCGSVNVAVQHLPAE